MQLSSLQGSVLENRIFEDDFQVQSISTAKLLQVNSQQYANDTQLLTIDNTNIAALLPILPFDQSILDDITDAVNQNFIIRIPQTEMVYQDWRGIGYLKEKAETGESGWMLSGSIAGGMTALSLDKWPEIYLDTLQNPFAAENTYAGPSTYDPVSGNYLKKVAATDLQTGLVGAPLPKRLQVKVTDSKQKPMPGVTITFTIKAGGGTLDNVTATTNALGIASTKLTLGKYTKANSAFQQISGDMNFTQVGENIVDAALPSGANLSTPFTAIAVPGQPRHMRKTFGDGMWSAVLSFAGFVSVEVEDEYDNPISNIPVLFQVKDSVQNPNTPNCPIPTTDTRNAYLIESAAPCLKQAPTWGICGITSNQAMTIMTDNTGASAEVILGGREDAIYAISAVVASNPLLNTEFKMYTYDSYFMNNRPCTGTDDPYYELFAIYTYTSDQYGNNINAGKTNSTIPVQANYYYLAEEETNVDVTLNCGSGPLTCNKVVGNRTYNIKKDFKSSNVTFSGVQGVEQGQGTGVFKANYKLKPGLNTVTINGTATIGINKTTMGCPGTCNTAPQDLAKTTMTTMEVYGVEVKTQPIPMMLVNETGYLFSSQTITYTIEPLDSPYKAMTAYVFIYKDGNIVAQIPSETKGTGTATLSKGFQFDVHSKYEAEVVLNYGTGVEIRSEKKEPLLVAQLKVLTDEAAPATVDEIKFSKGNKSEKRYAIQLTAAGTPSSCASFRGSAIVVDSNGNAINPPAGDSITMYGKASYDLYFMTMGNICTGVLEETGTGVPWTKFALTNRAMQNSDVQIFTGNQATALYGGLGNKFRITLNGTTKDIPIEPVGVIILGIDGLRQDVLYPTQVNSTSTVTASYSDPNGCGDNVSCYVAPTHLTGLCEVLGGTFSNTCDTTTMKDKHIKLPGVTAIFPSITFASWASIFTGKMPNETGILGNEFFARDLYDPSNPTSNTAIPGMSPLPSGMVTLDADGGAFRAANATILPSMRFALNYVMPAEYIGFGYDTLTKKLNQSAPGATLSKSKTATPFWNDINTLVSAKYHTSNDPDTKCVGTEYECRTVTMFNQYAQGADWWGTPSFVTRSLWDATKSWYDASVTMDESSAHEATEFIEDYFKNTSINGKKKRFPAVFSVYLPGLDHDAHMKGMTDYTYFFTHTTDVQIQNIVTKLKDQDEFDNKIFIVTADHGHTAMPIFGDVTLPDGRTVKPDMSCELNVTDFDEADVQGAEQANNNLHIWELGEVFTAMGGLEGASIRTKYKILVPDEIEEASVTNGVPEEFSPTSDIGEADIVVALNGPMAHIYSMVGTDNATLGEIAEAFRVMLGGFYPDEASKYGFSDQYGYLKFQANNMRRLWNSIDKILIRLEDGDYYVFNGLDESGNPVAGDLSSLSELDYADGVKRIKGMNNKNRSGDIVLLMKDDVYYPETENIADHRFTSGVACKSWHGSLNRSDSYVPFFVTYPGGNKNEIEQILQKDILCKQDYSECKANWKLSDIVKEIISEQYK